MDKNVVSNVAAILFVTLLLITDGLYCWKVLTHRIAPRLATWLIFLVASGLSLISYLVHADGHASWVANIGNRMDAGLLFIIVGAIFISSRREPDRRKLSRFDRMCLGIAGIIIVFWAITGESVRANLCLQGLMCLAYGPMLGHFISEKRNTEPFGPWLLSLAITVICLIPAWVNGDVLGIIYAIRGIVCVSILLMVMLFARRSEKNRVMPR